MSWEKIKIGELCSKINTCNPINYFKDNEFFYFDIASVNPNTKCEEDVKRLAGNSAPSRARQLLKTDDILVSTVRPNLNAIAKISNNYDGAVASTGFTVLRTKNKQLDCNYLFYWLQSKLFIDDMVKLATGASYPAVSDTIIKNSLILLPPLPIQKKIADILNKADALRKKDQQLLQKYDELAQAIFIDMFGDPVKNEKGWDKMRLQDVAIKITDGEHGTVERLETGQPYLMARNIRNGFIDFTEVDYISDKDHNRIFKRCNPELGDLLLVCVGATIGRVSLMTIKDEFSLARSVALIKPNKLLVESAFLFAFFKTDYMQMQIKNANNSSAQAGLYTGKINDLKILIPPIKLQHQFKNKMENIFDQIGATKISLSNDLFQSLLQQAFKGELIA